MHRSVSNRILIEIAIILTSHLALLVDLRLIAHWYMRFPVTSLVMAVTTFCSLCLMGNVLWLVISLHSRNRLPLRYLWSRNTKDAFAGIITGMPHDQGRSPILSITGQSRSPPYPAWRVIHLIARFFAPLLFRRVRQVPCLSIHNAHNRYFFMVSPAETRGYAFTRNIFAVFFIAIIITRIIMGMFQAGNKFEKRIQSKPCVDASVDRNPMIDILMVSGPQHRIPYGFNYN